MKDLFKIDFEFMGQSVNLQIKNYLYDNLKEVQIFLLNEDYDSEAIFYKKRDNEKTLYIIFKEDNYKKPYWYSHELLHAIKYLCNSLNINDEEVECYMLGFLMREYTDNLQKMDSEFIK